MPFTVKASDHAAWEENSLQQFGEFSDCITECHQVDRGDYSLGTWFYIPDEPLKPMQGVGEHKSNERGIYFGTWGNDNSPGADHYTHCEIFDMDDEDDAAEYERRKAEWEAAPEWDAEYESCAGTCGETYDKETMHSDDGETYYCEACYQDLEDEDDEDEDDEDDEDEDDEDDEDDDDETQRRDEKHGLYPEHEDPAN